MILNSARGRTTPRQGNSMIQVVVQVHADAGSRAVVGVVPGTEGTWTGANSGGGGDGET
jgi:hypothetical protein